MVCRQLMMDERAFEGVLWWDEGYGKNSTHTNPFGL